MGQMGRAGLYRIEPSPLFHFLSLKPLGTQVGKVVL